MTYLLDSDVLIYHLKGVESVVETITGLFGEGVAISSITYMETLDGVDPDSVHGYDPNRFSTLVSKIPIIQFSQAEAERCVLIRRALRQQGRSTRSRALDLLIAATALEHGLTLVTNNQRDYVDIPGLRIRALESDIVS
jgi:tRNA(fMet)-specific endonuclease VapC